MLLVRKLMIHPIIKVLVVKLLILAINFPNLRTKPKNEVLILH